MYQCRRTYRKDSSPQQPPRGRFANAWQMVLALIVIAGVVAFTSQQTVAQNITFNRSSFSDGLPSSYIYSIVSDSSGQIWVGTNNGVSRYNGKSFRNYSTDNGIAHDKVRASICDNKGNVWFGHVNGQVSLFTSNHFETIASPLSVTDKIVLSIYQDNNGVFWTGTLGGGLLRYDGSFQSFTEEDGIQGEGIFDIEQDASGRYWIASEKGLTIIEGDLGAGGRILKNTRIRGLQSGLLRCLLPTESGMLVGTRESGVLYAADVSNLQTVQFQPILPENYQSVFVYDMYRDSKGRVWAGTYGSGLVLIQRNSELDTWQSRVFTKEDGLSNNFVQAIEQDREGNIWIGTNGGGICQMKEEAFSIIDESSGLPSNMVLTVFQDRKGVFWFGTDEGLVRYEQPTAPGESPSVTSFSSDIDPALRRVVSISENADGHLWLGTESSGPVVFDPEQQSVSVGPSEFRDLSVRATLVDSKDNVWFATARSGVLRFNPVSNDYKSFGLEEGITDSEVNVVFEDSHGVVWLGTESGLLFHQVGPSEFERVLEEEWSVYSPITSITQDGSGSLWVATDGDGVFQISGTSVQHFNEGHGIPSDKVLSVVYDEAYNQS